MTAVPWRWNTGKGRVGIEGKLCFWNQYFHGLWQDVLCTSSGGARAWDKWWKMAIQKNWPFFHFWAVRVIWKNTSFAPSYLLNIFDNKFWTQERKGTCREVFSILCWTKPVPYFFMFSPLRKCFFVFQLGCKCFPDCLYLCKKPREDLGRFCGLIKSHISWASFFSLNSPSILSGIQYSIIFSLKYLD